MSSKRIEIFTKACKFSENIFKMPRFLKKKPRILKKSVAAIAALPQWPLRPYSLLVHISGIKVEVMNKIINNRFLFNTPL
jgi:hypothetical protein